MEAKLSSIIISRFLNNIEIMESGCWNWKGKPGTGGYGRCWDGKKSVLAHRFSYTYFKGEIPHGLEPDHLCRNRICVNPDHLEVVTHQVNVRRGLLPLLSANRGRQYQESKTHCSNGHPFNEENTYIRIDRPGRECKTCRRESNRRWLIKC